MSHINIKDLAQNLSNIRQIPVLTFFLPKDLIHYKHFHTISNLIKDKQFDNLIILLDSGGGNINPAYQIIELIRNHCKCMTTYIPMYAKSAATLFVLASNKIVMHESSEIGPLDTQISESQKGARKFNSALNPFKTLEELQRFSLETMDVTAKLVLERSHLSIEEAIKIGMDFAARVSQPLYSKLDTEKMGEYSRALAVGQEYGTRLLQRYSPFFDKKEVINSVLEKLVKGYPSHDYIIDVKELKDIGFTIDFPGRDEKVVIDEIIQYLLQNQKETELYLLEPTLSLEDITQEANAVIKNVDTKKSNSEQTKHSIIK